MPLIYLILLRAMHVLRQGRKVPLHAKELLNLAQSCWTIWLAIKDRVKDLNGEFNISLCMFRHLKSYVAICRLQNLNVKEQFMKFSYGVVRDICYFPKAF